MKQATGDFALSFRHICDKIDGLSASFFDDILGAGTALYRSQMEVAVRSEFDVSKPQNPPVTYTGTKICARPYSISQSAYIEHLSNLATCCTYEDFDSQRQNIARITHTRPDIYCAVSFAAQVTAKTFMESHVKDLNNLALYLKSTSASHMKFPELDQESLYLLCNADSSFANLRDSSTQLGYIIVLADKSNKCSIISYCSYKSRCVVRLSSAGETLALADAFDTAIVLQHDIELILKRTVPILLLTDSQSLFAVLTTYSHTAERRLMLDLETLREAYTSKVIAKIGLIASERNAADAMTKLKANPSLWHLFSTNVIKHPVLK